MEVIWGTVTCKIPFFPIDVAVEMSGILGWMENALFLQCTTAHIPKGHFLAIFTNWRAQTSTYRDSVRVCLHGGGGPQESEVTRLSI